MTLDYPDENYGRDTHYREIKWLLFGIAVLNTLGFVFLYLILFVRLN